MLFWGGGGFKVFIGNWLLSLSTILSSKKLRSSLENIYEAYYVFGFCNKNYFTMKIIGSLDTFTPLYTL